MPRVVDRIRLAHPLIADEVMAEVHKILASGALTKGPVRRRFEKQLARACGVRHAVTLNSGTSALFAMLRAVEIKPGDRVIVPDYGFVATANAVELLGAQPVFVDIDPADFNLSPAALAQALKQPARAVLVVHQFGWPAKLDAIAPLASRAGAVVLEDSACALGTTVRGRPLGCASMAAAVSFHPRKVVTSGEGGAVLTDNGRLARAVRVFADHGFGASRQLETPGLNLRLPEVSCTIGRSQLAHLEEIVAARALIGAEYRRRLAGHPQLRLPPRAKNVRWNHQTFAVLIAETVDGERLLAKLAENHIEVTIAGSSLSDTPYYRRRYNTPAAQVAASRDVAGRTLALPCHERMTAADAARVCAVLLRVLDNA